MVKVEGIDNTGNDVEGEEVTEDTTEAVTGDSTSDNSLWVVIAVLVILARVGIAGYIYFMSKKNNKE